MPQFVLDPADFRRYPPAWFHQELGTWFVFGYDEVDALFHDPRLSNRRVDGFLPGGSPLRDVFERWVLMLDDPRHKEVRRLLQPMLSDRAVDRVEPRIRAIAAELLQGRVASMDLAADFAYPLPVLVLGEVLGVPTGDRHRLIGWSDAIADYFNTLPTTPELARGLHDAVTEMMAFLRGLQSWPDEDALANMVLLLVAGHETTRNAIGSTMWLLLRDPEALAAVREDRSLLRNALEEALRLEPPNPVMARIALEDVAVGDQVLRAGQMVYLVMAAANRDPAHFPDPDRFSLSRKPGRHMSFGSGPHYCVGAILARREGVIALETLLEALPSLRLDPARPPEFHRSLGMWGVRSLPVVWEGAAVVR